MSGAIATTQISQQPFTLPSQLSGLGSSTFDSAPTHLQKLSGRLITAHEDERRRIARELHDDVNQRLSLLAVELDLLAQSKCDDPAETQEQLVIVADQVRELVSDIQAMSHALHPTKLKHLGLVRALRSLCSDESRVHGIHVDFQSQSAPNSISLDVSFCLYRVAQEALRNVVKHSVSSNATVRLLGTQDHIELTIADSGCGFDHTSFDHTNGNEGLGLISMQERVSQVAGQLHVASARGRGTQIKATIPLQRGQND